MRIRIDTYVRVSSYGRVSYWQFALIYPCTLLIIQVVWANKANHANILPARKRFCTSAIHVRLFEFQTDYSLWRFTEHTCVHGLLYVAVEIIEISYRSNISYRYRTILYQQYDICCCLYNTDLIETCWYKIAFSVSDPVGLSLWNSEPTSFFFGSQLEIGRYIDHNHP